MLNMLSHASNLTALALVTLANAHSPTNATIGFSSAQQSYSAGGKAVCTEGIVQISGILAPLMGYQVLGIQFLFM